MTQIEFHALKKKTLKEVALFILVNNTSKEDILNFYDDRGFLAKSEEELSRLSIFGNIFTDIVQKVIEHDTPASLNYMRYHTEMIRPYDPEK